jgi:hypothetical protein
MTFQEHEVRELTVAVSILTKDDARTRTENKFPARPGVPRDMRWIGNREETTLRTWGLGAGPADAACAGWRQ